MRTDCKKIAYLAGHAALSAGLCLLIGYLFYDNLALGLLGIPVGILNLKKKMKQYEKSRQERTAKEFCDGMQAVVSALIAGYSVENAFRESLSELELLYGKKSGIYRGFSRIVNELRVNVNIEDAFAEYAAGCRVEEITNFSEVLLYAKRSGGNMVEIIKDTAGTISEKTEVAREISSIISAKKLEQSIMNMVPMGIILYMRLTNGGMFQMLYNNAAGVMIMSICLIVYAVAKLIADKIVEIKI